MIAKLDGTRYCRFCGELTHYTDMCDKCESSAWALLNGSKRQSNAQSRTAWFPRCPYCGCRTENEGLCDDCKSQIAFRSQNVLEQINREKLMTQSDPLREKRITELKAMGFEVRDINTAVAKVRGPNWYVFALGVKTDICDFQESGAWDKLINEKFTTVHDANKLAGALEEIEEFLMVSFKGEHSIRDEGIMRILKIIQNALGRTKDVWE